MDATVFLNWKKLCFAFIQIKYNPFGYCRLVFKLVLKYQYLYKVKKWADIITLFKYWLRDVVPYVKQALRCFHTTQNDGINIVWVFKKYVNTNIGINLNISEEEKSSFNFPLISCFFLVCLILLPKSICIQSTFLVKTVWYRYTPKIL